MRDLLVKRMPFVIGSLRKIIGFAVFQPLVVFDGYMYGATVHGEDTKLEPIKFAQIQKRYVSSNYNEIFGMIHCMCYKSLPEYLELLRKYYWFF